MKFESSPKVSVQIEWPGWEAFLFVKAHQYGCSIEVHRSVPIEGGREYTEISSYYTVRQALCDTLNRYNDLPWPSAADLYHLQTQLEGSVQRGESR